MRQENDEHSEGHKELHIEEIIANDLAERAIETQPHLAEINQGLKEAEEPKPAIGVGLGTVKGARLPTIFIGYGCTQPGQGLRPITHVDYDGHGGRSFSFGLALPMDRTTQRSVTFWPIESDADDVPQASEVGWWQQWCPDRFSKYVPGQEPYVSDYSDRNVSFNDKPFATWQAPLFNHVPFIAANAGFAEEETSRALQVVQELPGPWRELYETGGQYLHQRVVVIGQAAVKAALEVLRQQTGGERPIPGPLQDMLGTVVLDLGLAD